MARRILNRKDLRADFDAAERTKTDAAEETEETEEEGDDEGEEDEDGEEEAGEGEAGDGEAAGAEDDDGAEDEDGGDDDDEDAPKKKKKKKVVAKVKAPKKPAKPRSRAAKVVRMKVVWAVFNNSNARVATYDYPKRKEAEDHAARLTTDKKSTHFVQPVKEPIEEKKE